MEGTTLWLDVGLQYRGRASPSEEDKVGVGGSTGLFKLMKVVPAYYNKANSTEESSLLPPISSAMSNGNNLVLVHFV